MYVYRLHLSFFAFEQSTYNAPGDGYDERKPPAEGQRQESRAKQNAEKQKNAGRDIGKQRIHNFLRVYHTSRYYRKYYDSKRHYKQQ